MNKSDSSGDHFDWFFKLTSYIFTPYLEIKYAPKEEKTTKDHLREWFIYLGSWVVVIWLYIGFVYLFIYKADIDHWAKAKDLLGGKGPIEIIQAVWGSAEIAPVFNLTFLAVLYAAITSHAEKHFLASKVLYLDLSGMIKTLKLGKFDRSSNISEQDESQINIARQNIYTAAKASDKELVSIISASGWDLFGDGHPLASAVTAPTSPPAPPTKPTTPPKVLHNGYMLDVISERFRKVQIILLDPNGPGATERAEQYIKQNGHKPIQTVAEYKAGIEKCLLKLKEAFKKNPNIEVRLVDEIPQWKMVLVEGEVWVQPIIPTHRSDHAPVYGFRKSDYSLYHTFFNINEAIWHCKKTKKYDLS